MQCTNRSHCSEQPTTCSGVQQPLQKATQRIASAGGQCCHACLELKLICGCFVFFEPSVFQKNKGREKARDSRFGGETMGGRGRAAGANQSTSSACNVSRPNSCSSNVELRFTVAAQSFELSVCIVACHTLLRG